MIVIEMIALGVDDIVGRVDVFGGRCSLIISCRESDRISFLVMDRKDDAVVKDICHACLQHPADAGLDHVFILEAVIFQIFIDLIVIGIQTDIEVFDDFLL